MDRAVAAFQAFACSPYSAGSIIPRGYLTAGPHPRTRACRAASRRSACGSRPWPRADRKRRSP